ncbi:universal stress protein [Massilia niastensis]|uniref:universal stress protein n=1 Tax=Massilia niastensis TaxID=544911 RepID=UPI00037BFBE1|nr:universal stress protein [Massilia niastensis]
MFIERICVATDGSDLAVRAAQMAVVLARTGGHRIIAFSVAQPHFSIPSGVVAAADLEDELRRAQEAAHKHVDTVARIAHDAGVSCQTLTALSSSPGPEIVRVAEENGCDLIVMGAHGPSDGGKRFAGSVAQHVLAFSSIPVLVLRDPREPPPPEFSEDAPA